MYLKIFFALFVLKCISGDPQSANKFPVVAPTPNPYYPGYNFGASGYNPYYNTASASAPILSYSSNQGIDGSYNFSFATGDGKQAEEIGYLKNTYVDNTGAPQGTQVKEGSFSYVSPEGTPIHLKYIADENGFRPLGFHIPADGRDNVPVGLLDRIKDSQINDPRYNLYDPYNRNLAYRQYNNLRPYDPRYSSDPNYYNRYNSYRPLPYNNALQQFKKDIPQQ